MNDYIPTQMTASEFAKQPENTLPTELIYGEIFVSPAPEDLHQKSAYHSVIFLSKIISEGEIRFATHVYLDDKTVLLPDIMWISQENTQCQLVEGRFWHGAPDLVIEVFSLTSPYRDKRKNSYTTKNMASANIGCSIQLQNTLKYGGLQSSSFVKIGIFRPGETFASPTLVGKMIEVGALFGK